MTRSLDVLVIESHHAAADSAVHALEASGHHVHRCFEDHGQGFACRGVVDPADCPWASHADVILVVRGRVDTRPSPLEPGVRCAIRAGLPIVEAGPTALDPYEPWLTARVEDDVLATCEEAFDLAFGELRREILRLATPILLGAGIVESETTCRIEPEPTGLTVWFESPVAASPAVEQALAVRVLDAIRRAGRTYGTVQVAVRPPGCGARSS